MAKAESSNPLNKQAKSQPTGSDGLVDMWKDGKTMPVHPSCVEAHRQAGWKVVE